MITEMGTRLRLLPHWCQTAGYIYLAAFLICSAFAYACPGNPCFRFISGNWNLVGMLNFAMIFLAIFSREKVEDEMTISIRVNALIYLVFFLFLIHMLVYLPDGSRIKSIIMEIKDFLMGDFGVLTILYAFLYKIMIWVNRWRLSDEE